MSVIFKFSILRTLKRKMFYIPLMVVILLNILTSLIVFNSFDEFMFVTIGSIFIILFNMIFIAFYNITNLSEFFIQDHISNIESLMIRKGKKPTTIFMSKLLANKIISITFILLVYILYIFSSLTTNIFQSELITNRYSIGMFVLVPFDLLITWITLLLAVCTKSYKKTLPVTWLFSVLFFMYPVIGPGLFIALGSTDLYDSNVISSLYRYENYKERKDNNKLLIKLYEDYNQSKQLSNDYVSLVNNNLKIDFVGENEDETIYYLDKNAIKKFISWMLSDSILRPQLYLLSKEDKVVDFITGYLNNTSYKNKASFTFDDNFNQDLKDLFTKDLFINDSVLLSPNKIDPKINMNTYWNNSYFNKNDKYIFYGENGINKSLILDNAKKIVDTNNEEINKTNKILENAFYYNFYNIKFHTDYFTSNSSEIEILEKIKFESNWLFLNNNIQIPYNYLSMLYILIDSLKEPEAILPTYAFNQESNYETNKLFYNLYPFNNFYIMANSFGSGDYYDAFVQKCSFLRGPIYTMVYQTNSIEQFDDPNIKPEYSSIDSYFNLSALYIAYIITSLCFIGMCYWIYVSRIYKKSGDK
ncbi:hypothetical protein SCORR_v1c06100 [Spiroplasma corruscae]|uniref:Uncharacterized protein n=1 Tax=Spiroplasma corruscae TaxID=216934 RepID=A0A222EPL0_9MOLU|nr:hypothetical protein [Spiroplasma corruscae]ASP28382.1 hypothetical protein SCORR_v1c06100 [Spiroplasma corruscae]